MGEETIRCRNCGHTFRASATGGSPRCPVCDAFALPIRAEPAEEGDSGPAEMGGLRVRRDVTVDGRSRKCTPCGQTVTLDDPVCPHCGFNAETGRFRQEVEERRRRTRAGLAWALGALAFAALGGWAWHAGWLTPPAREGAPAAPAVGTNAAVVSTAVEEQLVRELADSLRKDLNAKHPLIRSGTFVAVQTRGGELVRGALLAVTNGVCRIGTGNGTVELPLEEITRPWRLLIDPAYREQAVQAKAREKAQF